MRSKPDVKQHKEKFEQLRIEICEDYEWKKILKENKQSEEEKRGIVVIEMF